LEWAKKNMPLIEFVDNVKVNEAGHRFDLELKQTVAKIEPETLLSEEAKKTYKEFKDRIIKSIDSEELRPVTPVTPSMKIRETPKITKHEPDLAELEQITKQVLTDMERLKNKETDSYENAVQIWPDIFLTNVRPVSEPINEEKKEISNSTQEIKENIDINPEKLSPIKEEVGKEEEKQKVAKMPLKTIKKSGTPQKIQERVTPNPKVTSMKKLIQYKKKPELLTSSKDQMFRSNGFIQPDLPPTLAKMPKRPSSRAKNKYETARQIDSSLNPKK